MSQQTPDVDERSTDAGSWLAADLEGRTVGFWIAVAVAIAVVVVGFGAWWVWGLGRGMPMDAAGGMTSGVDDMGMEDMPHPTCGSPLRTVVLVAWHDEDQARELTSADDVQAAGDAGDIEPEETDTVVNMPVLTWLGENADDDLHRP